MRRAASGFGATTSRMKWPGSTTSSNVTRQPDVGVVGRVYDEHDTAGIDCQTDRTDGWEREERPGTFGSPRAERAGGCAARPNYCAPQMDRVACEADPLF